MVSSEFGSYCKVLLFLAALAILAGLPHAAIVVNLVSPANGAVTNATDLVFNYTASGNGTANCTLYLNGTANGGNATLNNNTNWAISVSSNEGNYTWNVTCLHSNVTSGNNSSATYGVFLDHVAPACSLISVSTSSAYAYYNSASAALYYNNNSQGQASFTVSANSSDVTGSGVANVTFPSISGFPTPGGANTTLPYTWTYSWNQTSGTSGSQQTACRDYAGNNNFTSFNVTLDNTAPNITATLVEDADAFYSSYAGNSVSNFNITVSESGAGVSYIQAELANMTGTVNASLNLTNRSVTVWNGTFNLSGLLASLNFSQNNPVIPYNVNLYPYDRVSNAPTGQPISISLLLHDLGRFQGPPAGQSTCFAEGSAEEGQTNMSRILNFGAANLVMVGKLNGSAACGLQMTGINQTMPWGDSFRTMGKFNFTSVDISTQEKASSVMSAMGNLIRIQIAPPRSFGVSRIFVNTTNLTALNTTTAVTLYDLPFASSPAVVYDGGAANVTISWSQGAYSSMFNSSVGNLTITVSAFSGYNFTDNVTPAITFRSPTSGQNTSSRLVNVTLNGTGTEISAAYFYINGTQVANYTNATNTANCSAASPGSEIWNCAFTSNVSDGPRSLNVLAYDYGNASPGNLGNSTITFVQDTVAPTVAIQTPVANSKVTANSTTLNFTASDATTAVAFCEYSINGTRINTSSCANFTLNLTDGTKNLVIYATDTAGNTGSSGATFFADNSSSSNVVLNTSTSVSAANLQVMVGNSSPASNLTLSSSATNVSLNVSTLYDSSSRSAILPAAITVTASTSLGSVVVQIPANVTINSSSDWNGTLTMPTVQSSASASPTTSGTNSVTGVVEIGVSGTAITLSSAVRIVIPGKAGQKAGFARGGTFTEITTTCSSANSQSVIDSQLTGSTTDCVTPLDNDLVIWTKHFTQFISYTNTAPSSSSSNSGGGSVGGGGGAAPTTTKSTTQHSVDVGLGKSCPVSLAREISSSTYLSVLTNTIVNSGGADCTLSDFAFSDTIPDNFAAMNEITFSPSASSVTGRATLFFFPQFSPGESKTITYSVSRWVPISRINNFTAAAFLAKKQVASPEQPSAQPPAPAGQANKTATPAKPAATPTVPSAPAGQPSAGQPPAPSAPSILVLAGIAFAVVIVLAAVAYFVFARKKKRGL